MVTFGCPYGGAWETYREHVSIHESCIVAPSANLFFTAPPSPGGVNLVIGAQSHVYSLFNFMLPAAHIEIGERCQLGCVNFVSATEIVVGDDVLMAWGINILDSNHHSLYWDERQHDVRLCREDYVASNGRAIGMSMNWDQVAKQRVQIGSKVWIGFNAIILKGVTIGEGAIIAPGSVVTKDIPAWTMGGGNPFRPLKSLTPARPAGSEDPA